MSKKTVSVRPLGKRVTVALIDPPQVSPGGIILPDTASGPDLVSGRVLRVGEWAGDGVAISTEDVVMFSKYDATPISANGETVYVVAIEKLVVRLV